MPVEVLRSNIPRIFAQEFCHGTEDAALDHHSAVHAVVAVKMGQSFNRNAVQDDSVTVDPPPFHPVCRTSWAAIARVRQCADFKTHLGQLGWPDASQIVRGRGHRLVKKGNSSVQHGQVGARDGGAKSAAMPGATGPAVGGITRDTGTGHTPSLFGAGPVGCCLEKRSRVSVERSNLELMTTRLCSRVTCRAEATYTLTYDYADSLVVVGPLSYVHEPHSYDLCTTHANTLSVPQGWKIMRHSPVPPQ